MVFAILLNQVSALVFN